jgi:cytoskeletal protein CcmA (bactofilin family)
MFKKSEKTDTGTSSNTKTQSTIKPSASSISESSQENIKPATSRLSNSEETVIREEITIEGAIQGRGNLTIEGILKGTAEMDKHNFTVGQKGRVEGEVIAQDIVISGVLHGDIKALGQVKITQNADFNGKVKANSISIEDGAFFKGEIELDREPHRKNTSFVENKSGIAQKPPRESITKVVEDKKES